MATSQSKAGGGTDSRQYRLSLDADVRVQYDEKTGKIGADPYQLPPTAFGRDRMAWPEVTEIDVYH